MSWDWDAPIVTIRVPRWKKTPMTPNRYNTSTVVGGTALAMALLDPFITALGGWISTHSSVVFPPGYPALLQRCVEAAIVTWAAHYHTSGEPPAAP